MTSRSTTSVVRSSVLTFCALLITAMVVRREFLSPGASVTERQDRQLAGGLWDTLVSDGRRIGSPNASIILVEFADFECPACAEFTASALKGALASFPADFAIAFHHWPLNYHRLAYPAARAAECAALQGKFEQFHDTLYATQDSLGLLPFATVAERAGVPDLDAFEKCNNQAGSVSRIDQGIQLAKTVGGIGTPTVILDGTVLASVPDSAKLQHLIDEAIKRRRDR